jgi:hypothetical protein
MDLPAKFSSDDDPETILAKVELSHYISLCRLVGTIEGCIEVREHCDDSDIVDLIEDTLSDTET